MRTAGAATWSEGVAWRARTPATPRARSAGAFSVDLRHWQTLALDALVDLIGDIKTAKQNGATDAQLAAARDYHRRGQFMIDFVMSENSMGLSRPAGSDAHPGRRH